jgi:hypothetical protein
MNGFRNLGGPDALILAGMAVAVLLTGCGTALAQPAAGHFGRQPRTQPRTAAVVTGTRAQAQAYVRHAMAELSLPAGARPAHLKSLPEMMRVQAPAGTGWAGASRILIVPGQPEAVLQRISGHAPFNEPGGHTATPVVSSTMLAAPEPGLDAVPARSAAPAAAPARPPAAGLVGRVQPRHQLGEVVRLDERRRRRRPPRRVGGATFPYLRLP